MKYIESFKAFMGSELGTSWLDHPSIQSLLSIASSPVSNTEDFFYMTMDPKGTNEFADARKNGKYIRPIDTNNGGFLDSLKENRRSMEIKSTVAEWNERFQNAQNSMSSLNKLVSDLIAQMGKAGTPKEILQEMEKLKEDCKKRIAELLSQSQSSITAAHTLQEFFKENTGSSYNQFDGRIKKWLKQENREQLTSDEESWALGRLKEAYAKTSSNKADKKNWKLGGTYFNKCSKLVGKDLATVWFNKLQEEMD